MEKTTLYLPPELQRALKSAARQSGRPQAEIIREALTAYLGAQPRPRLRSIGVGDSGGFDAAESETWLDSEWGRR